MLAAAWSGHYPGLRNLGKAVSVFLDDVVDEKAPDTYWVPGKQHDQDKPV